MIISNNPLFANQFESQIQRLMQLESRKKIQLQTQQQNFTVKKNVLSAIGDKLSSLNSLLTSFQESSAEKFRPLTGTSSNPDAVEIISTSGLNDSASYSITVNQLAKEDIILSNDISQTGTDFSATGSGSFKITIGSGTATTINIDTTGLNNQEVLDAIATEVNTKLDDTVTATVYELGNGNSKLSFKSMETGEAGRISITGKQGDFSTLNLSNIYTTGELNAQFTIDTISFQRSSNVIDDVIDGFTFELNQTTSAAEELTITLDTEEAQNNVEKFIDRFNEVNEIIRSQTFLDGETGNEGPLQNKRMVRRLSYSLRQIAFTPVESLAGNNINSLASIGIEMGQDGSLEITDSDALNKALKENSETVMKLFSADDGVAAKLKSEIGRYISEDTDTSIFESLQHGFDRNIDRLDERIESQNDYLARREKQLRAEFTQLAQVINQGERQFNSVLNFRSQLLGL